MVELDLSFLQINHLLCLLHPNNIIDFNHSATIAKILQRNFAIKLENKFH